MVEEEEEGGRLEETGPGQYDLLPTLMTQTQIQRQWEQQQWEPRGALIHTLSLQ